MSVAGIDIGNSTSCIALARKGGVDLLLNKESNRETPSVVTFNAKQRQAGTDAVGAMATNPRSTVFQLKRLLGKQFSDPDVQHDLTELPFKVVAASDGGCEVEVSYRGEPARFAPEQLVAALLADLRAQAEREQDGPVTEAVLAVPLYWGEAERAAMLAAGQAAGLDVLRLLPDTTAIALSYGIYKTDLSEDVAQHAVFVDVGHAATQVCVCALKRGQVQILGTAWDRNLGGRDLDAAIFAHFARQVQSKHGLDVRSNPRASLRLRMACERVKKVLTTNPEAPWSVECLMEDTDVSGSLTRDEFESLAAPVLGRLMAPVQEAMRQAELAPQDVQVIELLGSSSRVPSVVRQLGEFFGREPGRTLNAKETVARGCALQSAMLSPNFRVRELAVLDAFPHAIRFCWDKDGERVVSDVFERGAAVPSAKMLTFYRSEPFEIECAYGPSQDPAISNKHVATFAVGPFEVPAGAAAAKLKVKVMLNLNGRLVLDSVQSVVEEEVAEDEAKPAEAQDSTAMDQDAKDDKEANDDKEAASQPADAPAEAPPPKPRKKRVRKTSVPAETRSAAPSAERLAALFEAECEAALVARVQEETNEAKNAVEAYVYAVRNGLQGGALERFASDAQREPLLRALDAAEEWLYEEGEDESKSAYQAKLAELRALGGPVQRRAAEADAAPRAADALEAACAQALAAVDAQERAHVPAEERDRLRREAQVDAEWLAAKRDMAERQSAWDEPVLVAADLERKRETLERLLRDFLARPPPKPEAAPASEVEAPGEAAAEPEQGMDVEGEEKMDE